MILRLIPAWVLIYLLLGALYSFIGGADTKSYEWIPGSNGQLESVKREFQNATQWIEKDFSED